ncbi:unnamed protein product [Dracunculus medinensis]|uniref:DNA repair protein RAD50 n=1 Tax=Dracunculus medinensis TaxID=318479 RepID=A0A0N4UNH1_DRAME|nr:unnamed protein product [Dracunculus medinensis]
MHRLNEQLRKSLLKYRIEMVKAKQEKARQEKEPLADLRNLEENLRKKNDDILFEMERKKGEVIQQKARIDEIRKQLNSQDFLDVETKFKQEFITKFVTENVIKDLTTYIHIVDESIVQYHAKKMEEINEILGTLWGKVYRGNDIDRIQIRSESVDEGEKRKSYNYRVVMCVEGMEFDMPGRCSAGQKMLASILIRIALSDVFCDKCSVIALDEPTANLDVFKVENLGEILAEIIEARCNYTDKNFQLIVITHDDRFVEHLRQLCRPEWVYAISKDSAGFNYPVFSNFFGICIRSFL